MEKVISAMTARRNPGRILWNCTAGQCTLGPGTAGQKPAQGGKGD